jgi:hypothetical protein
MFGMVGGDFSQAAKHVLGERIGLRQHGGCSLRKNVGMV